VEVTDQRRTMVPQISGRTLLLLN